MSETAAPKPSSGNLDRAFVGGVIWTAGAKWSTQILTWGSTIAVARILTPEDFGLVAMAGAISTVAKVMAEFGIGSAVLQMQSLEDNVIQQLNTVCTAAGLVLFVLGLAFIPALQAFYGTEAVGPIFVLSTIAFILTGLSVVPLATLRKELNYRALSLADMARVTTQSFVTVACAFAGMGYWSLPIGGLSGSFSALAFVLARKYVSFRFPRWADVGPAIQFGGRVTFSQLAVSLYSNSPAILLGRHLGADLAGAYQMASNIAEMPQEKLADLVMRVTGPIFAKAQHDRDLIRRYILTFTETLLICILPLTMGVALVGKDLVELLFASKWERSVAPMQWLCVLVSVRTLMPLVGQALFALRQERYVLRRSSLSLIVMPLAFYAASLIDIWVVAASWLLIIPLNFVPDLRRVHRETGLAWSEYFLALLPALTCVSIMAVAVIGMRYFLDAQQIMSPLIRLILMILTGGLVYCSALLLLFRSRIQRYIDFAKRLRGKKPGTSETVAIS